MTQNENVQDDLKELIGAIAYKEDGSYLGTISSLVYLLGSTSAGINIVVSSIFTDEILKY